MFGTTLSPKIIITIDKSAIMNTAGTIVRQKGIPRDFNAVISLSCENLPNAISDAISDAIGTASENIQARL